MKYFIILLLMINIAQRTIAQEIRVKNMMGYSLAETNRGKSIMLSTESCMEIESNLSGEFKYSIGIASNTLKANFSDTANFSIFFTRRSVIIPLSVTKYYYLSKTAKGFIGVTFRASYIFLDQKEFITGGHKVNQRINNLGYNGGLGINAGYKRLIAKTISFEVFLSGHVDYIFKYKNPDNKIKSNAKLLGIGFTKILGQ